MEQIIEQDQFQLSLVTTDALTKKDREGFIENLFVKIEEGKIDPLTAHLQLKSIEDILKRLTDKQKYEMTSKKWAELVLEQAQKHGGRSFEFMNAKVEIKEVGTSYDYSNCGDPVIAELHAELSALKEKVKAREELLQKVLPKGMRLLIEETGEAVMVYPPAKKSTTSVVVTLK